MNQSIVDSANIAVAPGSSAEIYRGRQRTGRSLWTKFPGCLTVRRDSTRGWFRVPERCNRLTVGPFLGFSWWSGRVTPVLPVAPSKAEIVAYFARM